MKTKTTTNEYRMPITFKKRPRSLIRNLLPIIAVSIILACPFVRGESGNEILGLISKIDPGNPREANILRLEIQMILDNSVEFPLQELEGLVLDRSRNPASRIFAQELLESWSPKTAIRLDRVLLEEQVGDLRYPGISRLMKMAGRFKDEKEYDKATAIYLPLLYRAASLEQNAGIIESLNEISAENLDTSNPESKFSPGESGGYIIEWEISKPYENPEGNSLDEKFPPEIEDESAGMPEWKKLTTERADGKLDLAPFTEEKTNLSLYARCVIESSTEKPVSIRFSTQKTGKVWLNGKELGRFPLNDDGSDVPDKYIMDAVFRPGENVLMVKNTRYTDPGAAAALQGGPGGGRGGGWPFQVRVCDVSGVPLVMANTIEKPSIPDSFFDNESYTKENIPSEDIASTNPATEKESSKLDFMQFRTSLNNPVFKDVICGNTVFGNDAAWKTTVPGQSASGPIIVNDRVIVTSADGPGESRLHTIAYDLASGRKLWQRTLNATGSLLCYRPFSSLAAHTPASDGSRIIAMFSGNDLVCFDLEGNLVWYRTLGLENPDVIVSVGMAASPLILDGKVIVQCHSNTRSFAEAIEIETGKTLWKIDRPKGQGWSSPTVFPREDGSNLVVFQDRTGCYIHDPTDGKLLNSYEAKCGLTCSPISHKGKVFLASEGTTALRFDPENETPEILWSSTKIAAGSPSLAIEGNKIYIIKSPGVLVCADAESGDLVWQMRLAGSFYASPVVLGDHLFAANQQGVLFHVLLEGEKGEIIEELELGENVLGTPAVSEKAIFIRTQKSLIRYELAE